MTTNRLETIANRHRRSRTRDIVFAAFVALAAVISATTVTTAAHEATPIASSR
jgi:hypothetical protein